MQVDFIKLNVTTKELSITVLQRSATRLARLQQRQQRLSRNRDSPKIVAANIVKLQIFLSPLFRCLSKANNIVASQIFAKAVLKYLLHQLQKRFLFWHCSP